MKNTCPKCKSTNVKTERRPNGDSECLDCGHKDKSINFQTAQSQFPQLNNVQALAEKFASPEEQKAYAEAQTKTINNLNVKIKELNTQLENLKAENLKLKTESSISAAGLQSAVTNEETICITQLSIIKDNAMIRELTMDEVKRTEILVKTLSLIRGKAEEKKSEKDTSKMSTAELMKYAEDLSKDPQ